MRKETSLKIWVKNQSEENTISLTNQYIYEEEEKKKKKEDPVVTLKKIKFE